MAARQDAATNVVFLDEMRQEVRCGEVAPVQEPESSTHDWLGEGFTILALLAHDDRRAAVEALRLLQAGRGAGRGRGEHAAQHRQHASPDLRVCLSEHEQQLVLFGRSARRPYLIRL
jgi:hypothetical protein